MILSIYKVTEVSTNNSFYDLELNNFICGLGTHNGLPSMITEIEDVHEPNSLIHNELVSLNQLYKSVDTEYSTTLITSIEFENDVDLQARLRSVLETNHPELFI